MRSVFLVCGTMFSVMTMAVPAGAAKLSGINGGISVNTGGGFQRIRGVANLNPGDRIMAGPDGKAEIVYDDGCKVPVAPGQVVTVTTTSPCRVGQTILGVDEPTLVFGGFAALSAGAGTLVTSGGGNNSIPASP